MENKKNKFINIISLAILAVVFVSNFASIKSMFVPERYVRPTEKTAVAKINYPLSSEIMAAMDNAHNAAYDYASVEIDKWIDDMMSRVDSEFLDDYFAFMSVKQREMKSLVNGLLHFVNPGNESAEVAATRELEERLSRTVIRPQLSQAKIENITNQAIVKYMETFDDELSKLQQTYKIPTPEWNKYICDICGLTMDIKNKSYPVKFKIAFVSGTAAVGIVAAPLVKKVFVKISEKMAAKAGAKAGTAVATRALTKNASKAAGKGAAKGAATVAKAVPYVGLGIAVAIGIWDIFDYAKTSAEGKRLLRQSLQDYFGEVKAEMLSGSEESVMGSLILWENDLKKNIYEKNGV